MDEESDLDRIKADDDPFLGKHVAPGVRRFDQFDFGELARRLGEVGSTLDDADYAALGNALREIFAWAVRVEGMQGHPAKRQLQKIGRRFVALAWVVNPAFFDGSPTAFDLAKRLGCHDVTLLREAKAASRLFNLKNRSQRQTQ